ncbi:hypothetical protein O1611_g6653 [Lasiodiplodia mahajangana]|uniref:Uncharacterized protein n=1 Tax=Lasiodiplodia mahajangana TaxID=1108764 RepID=A0ACC2JHI5_9PEZI|nr:hypothetical protein O1611_g6653 [Lasiodiplodia mahajangana]
MAFIAPTASGHPGLGLSKPPREHSPGDKELDDHDTSYTDIELPWNSLFDPLIYPPGSPTEENSITRYQQYEDASPECRPRRTTRQTWKVKEAGSWKDILKRAGRSSSIRKKRPKSRVKVTKTQQSQLEELPRVMKVDEKEPDVAENILAWTPKNLSNNIEGEIGREIVFQVSVWPQNEQQRMKSSQKPPRPSVTRRLERTQHQANAARSATWGGATTAPTGDSDLDCEDDSEALAYLRSVSCGGRKRSVG